MLLINPGRFPPPSTSGRYLVSSTDEVFTSPDGVTWTLRSSDPGNWGRAARVLSTNIVLLSQWGKDDPDPGLISTDNGVSWSPLTMPAETFEWAAIAENGSGTVVVVGDPDTTNPMASSTNATSWTARSATAHLYRGVLWAASLGMFIAYNEGDGTDVVETSTNGTTWVNRTAGASLHYWGKQMAWSGGKAVVVGKDASTDETMILHSSNGTSWSILDPGLTEKAGEWDRTLWDGTQFVALGNNLVTGTSTDGLIITSADGVTWAAAYISDMVTPYSLVWTGSEYAVLAGSGGDEIWTSPDLVTWTNVGTLTLSAGPANMLEWIPD